MNQKIILNKLKKAKKNNHKYLSYTNDLYLEHLAKTIYVIRPFLKKKEIKNIFNKLQINQSSVNLKQYIQASCELTLQKYLAKEFPSSFTYEAQVNSKNNKDVEGTIDIDNITINIEVKCSTFEAQEKINKKNGFKMSYWGRVPNPQKEFEEIKELLKEGQLNKGEKPSETNLTKHMDNNLKSYLINANDKFNLSSSKEELNILMIGCDTPSDMDKWVGYMFGYKGLFQNDSFCEPKKYNLVDIVLLTNLYHRHKNPKSIGNNKVFDLSKAFVVGFINPRPNVNKRNAIKIFLNNFHNQTNELNQYDITNISDEIVESSIKISSFVNENKEYKRSFFNKQFN